MKTIMLPLIILCLTLIACQVTEKDVDKLIVCDSPYIRHEAGCCLDQNTNKICDSDETLNTAPKTDNTLSRVCEMDISYFATCIQKIGDGEPDLGPNCGEPKNWKSLPSAFEYANSKGLGFIYAGKEDVNCATNNDCLKVLKEVYIQSGLTTESQWNEQISRVTELGIIRCS
jgi:hypothetical protein